MKFSQNFSEQMEKQFLIILIFITNYYHHQVYILHLNYFVQFFIKLQLDIPQKFQFMEKKCSFNHKYAFTVFNHLVICRMLFNTYQKSLKNYNPAVNFINGLKVDESRIIRIIKEDQFIANSLSLIIQSKISDLSDKQLIILFDMLTYRRRHLQKFCVLLANVQIKDEKLIKCIQDLNALLEVIMFFCGDKIKHHIAPASSLMTINGPSLTIQQKKLISKAHFYSLTQKNVANIRQIESLQKSLYIKSQNRKQTTFHKKVPSISVCTPLQSKDTNEMYKETASTLTKKTWLKNKKEYKSIETAKSINKYTEIQNRSSSLYQNKRFIQTATTKATEKRPGSSFIKDIKKKFYQNEPKKRIKKNVKKYKFKAIPVNQVNENIQKEKKKSINIQPQSKEQLLTDSKLGEKFLPTTNSYKKRISILPNRGGYNFASKANHKHQTKADIEQKQDISSSNSSQQNVQKKQFKAPIHHHRNAFFSKHTNQRKETFTSNTPIKIKDEEIKSEKKLPKSTNNKSMKNSQNSIFRSSGYDSQVSKPKFSKKDNVTQLRRKACALTEIVEFDPKNLQQQKINQNKHLDNQQIFYDGQANQVKISEIFSLHQEFKQVKNGTYTPKVNKNLFISEEMNETLNKIRSFIIPIAELYPNKKLPIRIKTDPYENLNIDFTRCFLKNYDMLQQKNLEIERDWDRDLEIMDFYD